MSTIFSRSQCVKKTVSTIHLHPPTPRCMYLFIVFVVICKGDDPAQCNADGGYSPALCGGFPHIRAECPYMCHLCWNENIRGTRHWGLNWQTKPSVHFLQLYVDVLDQMKKHIAVCGVCYICLLFVDKMQVVPVQCQARIGAGLLLTLLIETYFWNLNQFPYLKNNFKNVFCKMQPHWMQC